MQGGKIDWKKDKNVTVKMVKKKQKHKSRGSVRVVTKQVKNDSFFNFFDPPTGRTNLKLIFVLCSSMLKTMHLFEILMLHFIFVGNNFS